MAANHLFFVIDFLLGIIILNRSDIRIVFSLFIFIFLIFSEGTLEICFP